MAKKHKIDETAKVALIDADVLQYLIGFAVQKTIWTHKQTGEFFEGKKKAKEWYTEVYTDEFNEEDWEQELEVEEWANCRYLLDNKIGEILYKTKADEAILLFSPSKNFRHRVAVTKEYKGNRTGAKPEYYDEIREYLTANYNYIIGKDVEADDLMGMMQSPKTVIATIDKDLDMIPGEHYNFNKDELYYTDELQSDQFFLQQMLSGDPVDNIQGIPGMGVKRAKGIVESYDGDHEGLVMEIKELYETYYPGEGEEVMKEMAQLLWILRKGEKPERAGWQKLLGVT